jgi:DNA-binding MarR family transcriptional regulator
LIDVDHEDTIIRSFIMFMQTAYAILKYADAHLYRKARLSISKLIVLRVLASNKKVMTPSEIAKWTQTERHNITTLIGRMKRDGLIRTERNPRDRRFLSVSLTDKGREVLMQAMPVAREIVDQVMSSISEDDALLLEKWLRVLRQNAHQGLEYVAKRSQP